MCCPLQALTISISKMEGVKLNIERLSAPGPELGTGFREEGPEGSASQTNFGNLWNNYLHLRALSARNPTVKKESCGRTERTGFQSTLIFIVVLRKLWWSSSTE